MMKNYQANLYSANNKETCETWQHKLIESNQKLNATR